jgi:hypothetical protein
VRALIFIYFLEAWLIVASFPRRPSGGTIIPMPNVSSHEEHNEYSVILILSAQMSVASCCSIPRFSREGLTLKCRHKDGPALSFHPRGRWKLGWIQTRFC